MSVSSAEQAKTTETVKPVQEDAASSEVLITTAAVLFGTAAARSENRDKTGGRFGGIVRRFFPRTTDGSHPHPHDAPRRYAFIESALMEREMGRL